MLRAYRWGWVSAAAFSFMTATLHFRIGRAGAVLTAALVASLASPGRVGAQALYGGGWGGYASVWWGPAFLHDRDFTWLGLGARLGRQTSLEVRAARLEDVPAGNPLPVTYIGYTGLAARVEQVFVDERGRPGWLLAADLTGLVADRSEPVSNVDAGTVTFRAGRWLATYSTRFELSRVWPLTSGADVRFFPRLGAVVEHKVGRTSTTRYDPQGIVGTNEGWEQTHFVLLAAVGVSLPLSHRLRVVLEPQVLNAPGSTDLIGITRAAIEF